MLNLAIGQGELLVTPISLLRYASIVANGGWCITPHYGRALVDRATGEREELSFPQQSVQLSARTWEMVKTSTADVIQPGGTAGFLRRDLYDAAGQNRNRRNPHGDDHSLFMAWMPVEAPEVVVFALVENAGHGSDVAAPIAFELFDAWYERAHPGSHVSRAYVPRPVVATLALLITRAQRRTKDVRADSEALRLGSLLQCCCC